MDPAVDVELKTARAFRSNARGSGHRVVVIGEDAMESAVWAVSEVEIFLPLVLLVSAAVAKVVALLLCDVFASATAATGGAPDGHRTPSNRKQMANV